jgi:hypothetical protein
VRASGDSALVAALGRAGPDRIKGALGAALAQALPQAAPGSLHDPDTLCEHFLACVAGSRFAPADGASATEERAARGLERFLRALAPVPASQRPMVSMSG